jgi:hypothetical protein
MKFCESPRVIEVRQDEGRVEEDGIGVSGERTVAGGVFAAPGDKQEFACVSGEEVRERLLVYPN